MRARTCPLSPVLREEGRVRGRAEAAFVRAIVVDLQLTCAWKLLPLNPLPRPLSAEYVVGGGMPKPDVPFRSQRGSTMADTHPTDHAPASPRTTPWPVIAAAWVVVGVPAVWGVSQTVRTATALFRPPQATAVPAAAGPASTAPSAATKPATPK